MARTQLAVIRTPRHTLRQVNSDTEVSNSPTPMPIRLGMASSPVWDHLDWLRQRGLRESTVRSRLYHLLRLVDWCKANGITDTVHDLVTLEEKHLLAWQRDLSRRITPAAQACYVSQIQGFYGWLTLNDIRPDNPSKRMVKPRVPRGRPRPITEADLQTALLAAPARIRPWLVLAGWAGLRACEISRLQRRDLDLEGDFPSLLVADGKGGKQRVVPLHPAVVSALHAAGLPGSGYVFKRHDNQAGPVMPWLVSQLANNHLHSLGIEASLHQLRHRFGTKAYQGCQDLRAVQELMGHAFPQTTAGYAAPSETMATRAVRSLPDVA